MVLLEDRERVAQDPLFDPFATVNSRDPYRAYRVLRDEHPVYHVGARDVWIVSRFEDVRAVSRDWRRFSNWPSVDLDDTLDIVGPGSFIDMDPPRHDVFRKMLQPRFTPKEINGRYTPVAEAVVDELLDEIGDAQEVDFADVFAWRVPVAMLCRLMGFPPADWGWLAGLFRDLVAREPGTPVAPESTRVAAKALMEYTNEALEERKRADTDDLLSTILANVQAGVIGDEEVRGLCLLLFNAGTTTTAALISNSFDVLARHPDQRQLLVEQPELIPNAVEEVLRYEVPVHYVARRAIEDVEMHGQRIPAEARLALLHGAANRDERRFDDPDVFDVRREVGRHLAFGEGIHFCLGAPLARLEATVVLDKVLARYPEYSLIGEGSRSTEHTTRGFFELPVSVGT